ncbi:hypothetical protein EYR41_005220 [Orbilia oligospora]|uniref:Uncharacterized protein n=1 Tax=Orbilia oligospora TaxID=2813651 RepID=A0A8H2DY61_ORBOL|nr:hypothetical protein TWF103_002852 [Orbilia oligospora]TGJ69160.1 hypothetical protein EYR41_005220 [Orbilia oligospora]
MLVLHLEVNTEPSPIGALIQSSRSTLWPIFQTEVRHLKLAPHIKFMESELTSENARVAARPKLAQPMVLS